MRIALYQLIIWFPLFRFHHGLVNFGCHSAYFDNVANVAPSDVDLAASRELSRVSSLARCAVTCFVQPSCRSALYDQSLYSCYLSDNLLNLTSISGATAFSQLNIYTQCTEFNDCSLSTVCSALPVSRKVFTGCIDANNKGNVVSGPYYVDPDSAGSFLVWCDFIGNEAWAVFQRRLDGSINFYRGWNDYKNGFGGISGEYWLGLERIYRLTNKLQPKLSIYLSDFAGASRMANYSSMSLSNEASSYTLTLGTYTGDAGDALGAGSGQSAIGMQFSTYDRDNDITGGENCAAHYQGAWWYRSCHDSNLNGLYLRGTHTTFANGVNWKQWHGYYYSLKTTIMRVAV